MRKPSFLGISVFFVTLFISAEFAGYLLTLKYPYSFSTKNSYLKPPDRSLSLYHQKYGYFDEDSNFINGRHQSIYKTTGAAFGCSFTFGDEVSKENTWSALLSNKLNSNILNFGQRSWGFDQALLLYEDVAHRIPRNSYVFLGIISDHARRIQNVYRRSCSLTSGIFLTKPRFAIEDNELVLLENPITKSDDHSKLSNWTFLEGILTNDECYTQRLKDWGPLHESPYFRTFFRALYYFSKDKTFELRPQLNVNSEGLQILTRKLLEKFKNDAKKNRHTPILIQYPEKWERDRYCDNPLGAKPLNSYSRVVKALAKDIGLQFYDFLDSDLCSIKEELYARNGHPNKVFHSYISGVLYESLFQSEQSP